MPDAVLFDLDGTLISTKGLYLEAYRRAVEPYIRQELTPEEILAMRPTSERAFLRAVVREADFEACLEDFYGVYRELHGTLFRGVVPGVAPLLAALRESAVPLGLVTGKSRRSWEITRSVVSLGRFDVLIFDDDVRAPKPDPHGLEVALDVLGVDAAGSVYVGDTISDVRAARVAGLAAVTVLWAREPADRPALATRAREEGALAVVERVEDLYAVLELTR